GLKRVPALHAVVARARAAADLNIKLTNHRRHRRNLLLVLRCCSGLVHRGATVGAARRQRGGVSLVNPPRNTATPSLAVGLSWLAPGSLGGGLRGTLRKRCSLALAVATCGVEFILQSLVLTAKSFLLALKSLARSLGPLQIAPQPLDLASLLIDDSLRFGLRWRGALAHAMCMPDFVEKYK